MDTSETYIKMCEKAMEIQGAWKPQVGDYIWRKYTVFGEEIDNQVWGEDKLKEIIILHFQSSVEGYWAACNREGEDRVFKTPEDMAKATSVWLPRQDELQGMVGGPYQHDIPEMQSIGRHAQLIQLIRDIDLFSQQINLKSITSMEQLWLAFIMKAKYGKVWNGEDWARELMAESAVSDL
jgi:hypothetical protein